MAGRQDVYLDRGNLMPQALDAGLVDELTVALSPIVLGIGVPLIGVTLLTH